MEVSIPISTCPTCKYETDMATSPFHDKAQPDAGDLSVCIGCGALGQFTHDLTLIAFPPEDFSLLPIEMRKEIWRVQKAISQMHEQKKGE